MSLGECPDCEKKVSLSAAACPNCGCPFGEEPKIWSGVRLVRMGFSAVAKMALPAIAVAYAAASWSLGSFATLDDLKLLSGVQAPDCTNIISQVYNLSHEEKTRMLGVSIVHLKPTQTLEQTETSVSCQGLAKLSNAKTVLIEYKLYEDDGQQWLGYRQLTPTYSARP